MNKPILIILTLICSAMLSLPILAQNATTAPIKSAPIKEVLPRDLMTFNERLEMLHNMRAANTPEERFQLRQQKYAELQKRAAEKGLVLRDHGPMNMNMAEFYANSIRMHWSDHTGIRWYGHCRAYGIPPLMK